jgi:hypothetical protein
MIRLFFGLFLFYSMTLSNSFAQTKSNQCIRVLVVTGGHDYDTLAFFTMWNQLPGIKYSHVKQPEANRLLETGGMSSYDVIVFYDMQREISDTQKSAWIDLLSKGKGMVFLHHSIVSYPFWNTYLEMVGGRYHEISFEKNGIKQPASNYTHDLTMEISVLDENHPITRGLPNFKIEDEAYGNLEVQDNVHVLLANKHPKATQKAMWTNEFEKSRIVYMAFGHDHKSYENPNFQLLLSRSIQWVCSQN